DAWLGEAATIMARESLEDADIGRASGLVDEALALNPSHESAVKLRQELLGLRKKRERQREVAKQVRAVLARARASLDEEDYDGAIEYCDDALLLAEASVEARDLRARALAAKEDERRAKDARRIVKEARKEFEAGRYEAAIARLEQFSPSHEIVDGA